MLAQAIAHINNAVLYERLIVISDEQSADGAVTPTAPLAYMLNVGSAQNGVGYGKQWVHIDGFSEACVRYIALYEALSKGEGR